MKNALVLAALVLAGTASAAKWEYAFLTDDMGQLLWTTPTVTYQAKAGLFKDLLTQLKCKQGDHPRLNFFNCVGGQGWEFVSVEKFSTDTTYIFRRVKP